MMETVNLPERVGVCIDTCHAFASGYDISTAEGFEKVFDRFEKVIGFKYLRGMHLSDAKGVLGQKLDRHDSLGKGTLGFLPFEKIVTDPRFDNIPLILETPDESVWQEEIAALQKLAR